jgi:hypothetical protein
LALAALVIVMLTFLSVVALALQARGARSEQARLRADLRALRDGAEEAVHNTRQMLQGLDAVRRATEELYDSLASRTTQARPEDAVGEPAVPSRPDARAHVASRASGVPYGVLDRESPLSANGRPVDIEDGSLVASRSLAAVGSLVAPAGSGEARLYINPDVLIDEFAFRKWSSWFTFGGGRPNRRYRTVQPSVVSWDEVAGRGTITKRGVAEEM